MPDVGSSSFDEVDANNSAASPDGFPTGMAPSGVDNSARAVMGAVKRFWNRHNAVKTTAGTTSAFTLTYDQAATAYYDGEIISFVMNATNAAAATINVNALGAKALRLFGGNLLAGALVTGQIVQARYGSSAGAFDIIPQNGWVVLGTQTPSAASTVDFTSIPAAVNHLMCVFEFKPSANNITMGLQTYGAAGALASAASDYYEAGWVIDTGGASAAVASAAASAITLCNASNIGNGSAGFGGQFTAMNIQALTYTKFKIGVAYRNDTASVGVEFNLSGVRVEADRITGVRFSPSSGTLTGRATLFGSV